ncbi:MAG: hypothetical protein F6J97_19610 [Leptolyngbya sp. SIO4C1]|nr:hypothetical protein [Leptolyngbya sp. SIO4C1]
MTNLDNLRIPQREIDQLTGLDISETSMGWAYRLSLFRSSKQILSWAVTQLLSFGVALILCLPVTLLLGRSVTGSAQTSTALSFIPLGVGAAIALTLGWMGYWLYQGRRLSTLNHLLDEIDRYHEILQAIEILDELQQVNPKSLSLDNRETVLEALHLTRENLICSLMTERVMRRHQRFIARRYDLFASIENNLAALQAFQVDAEAGEYGRLLNEALQIGASVHRELKELNEV